MVWVFRERIIKAVKNPEWRSLHGVADKQKIEWQDIFNDAVRETKEATTLKEIEEAMRAGNLARAEEVIPLDEFSSEMEKTVAPMASLMEQVGTGVAVKQLPKAVQAVYRFDISNPRTLEFIRDHTAELVTGVTDETRLAIRQVIDRAFTDGMHPRQSAKYIKELIGLTERDALAVDNLRRRLEAEGVPRDKAIKRIQVQKNKFLKARAETIARNETMLASNSGTWNSHMLAMEQGLIPENTIKRYITSRDDRVSNICKPLEGQRRPLDVPFDTALGPRMFPPVFPRCRCNYVLEFPK
jgi:SPP1 gp7 family putative phage head morphogenesis protein